MDHGDHSGHVLRDLILKIKSVDLFQIYETEKNLFSLSPVRNSVHAEEKDRCQNLSPLLRSTLSLGKAVVVLRDSLPGARCCGSKGSVYIGNRSSGTATRLWGRNSILRTAFVTCLESYSLIPVLSFTSFDLHALGILGK